MLLISSAAGKLLITGDIESPVERYLTASDPRMLDADIVLIPHHGSASSSTPAFVEAVSPAYALASTGYRNRYGFPKPEVVSRWQAAGAVVLDTAETGAISFTLKPGEGIAGPQTERERARRYWHHRPAQ